MYPLAKEKIPNDTPTQRGKGLKIIVEVHDDHAHDQETRMSVIWIVLCLNGTLQSWYSKRRHTVETSTYGSKLFAARIAVEMIIEYWYKLRMLGVLIIGASLLYRDKMAIIINASISGSNIRKKHHTCVYHFIIESSAAGIVNFIYKSSTKSS